MKELNGKISDKLRERFPPDAKEWRPERPAGPGPLGRMIAEEEKHERERT